MVPEVRSVISPSELANSRIDLDWNWVGLGWVVQMWIWIWNMVLCSGDASGLVGGGGGHL